MGDITNTANQLYADGPSGSPTQPDKAQIRALFGLIDDTGAAEAAARAAADASLKSDILNNASPPLTEVAAGQTVILAANTYANGTAGVGATITASANGALAGSTFDGATLAAGKRLFVGLEGAKNGIYVLTQLCDGTKPWILTRATDADTADKLGLCNFAVIGGTTLYGRSFKCQQKPADITIGTTALTFAIIKDDSAFSGEVLNARGTFPSLAERLNTFVSATFLDSAGEWLAFGGVVGLAFADKNGKLYGAYREDDGILRSRFALKSSTGGVSFAYDASTGYTDVSVSAVTSDDVELIVSGNPALLSLADAAGHVWGYGLGDGSFYFHRLRVGRIEGLSGGAADAAGAYFTTENVAGSYQIARYDKTSGIRSVVTSLGNNSAPHVSSDGAKVIYLSDRSTPASEWYQAVAGGPEYPLLSSSALVAWGNSLSTSSYYISKMARTVLSQGVGGQNDDQIAARMDAVPLTCVVAGNQIPAGGSVAVSGFAPNIWFHWNFTAGAFRANIIGAAGEIVAGTLTYSSGTLAFVRDAAGVAVNVPNPATVRITSGRVEGSIDASTAPALSDLLNRTSLLYPDYNSITQALAAGYSLANIFAREQADIARKQPLIKRFLLLGDYNGQARLTAAMSPGVGTAANDTAAKQLLDATLALNAMRKAAYPANFVDLHAGLVALGRSSQFTVGGTAYDVIDLATLPDGTHPSTQGSTDIAGIVTLGLNTLGF